MVWTLRFNDVVDIPANGDLLLLENISASRLIIFAKNPNARTTWRLACYVSISTKLEDFSEGINLVEALYKRVLLNHNTYIEIPNSISPYRLLFSFPRWHKSMSLQIWSKDVIVNDKTFSAETENSVISGQPLVLQVNGKLTLGNNQNFASAFVNCFAVSDSNPNESADYITEGQIYRDDWSDITNTLFLISGATYFLSSEDGKMTTIAPTESGSIVVVLGKALSPNLFDVEIQPPILL